MTIAWLRGDYLLMKDMGLFEMDDDEYADFLYELSGEGHEDGNYDLGYLKFLNENRHPDWPEFIGWSENCTQVAAGCGRLDILKYAKENGIPLLDECSQMDPCASAAEGGQLETLQWLRENDCPWDACTCARAIMAGHFEILRWALENGCPWDSEYTYSHAGLLGYDTQIMDWIDSTARTLYADQDEPGTLRDR